jgi:hypothetical protein
MGDDQNETARRPGKLPGLDRGAFYLPVELVVELTR